MHLLTTAHPNIYLYSRWKVVNAYIEPNLFETCQKYAILTRLPIKIIGGRKIMFRGLWGLKMVSEYPTVIDGYKKIVEKLIHESDHFAPTPIIIISFPCIPEMHDSFCTRDESD